MGEQVSIHSNHIFHQEIFVRTLFRFALSPQGFFFCLCVGFVLEGALAFPFSEGLAELSVPPLACSKSDMLGAEATVEAGTGS